MSVPFKNYFPIKNYGRVIHLVLCKLQGGRDPQYLRNLRNVRLIKPGSELPVTDQGRYSCFLRVQRDFNVRPHWVRYRSGLFES